MERNEQLGRFLVAKTDLKAGQLIFNELPMIVGPRQLTKPLCLGCHKELKDPKSVVNCSRLGTLLISLKLTMMHYSPNCPEINFSKKNIHFNFIADRG